MTDDIMRHTFTIPDNANMSMMKRIQRKSWNYLECSEFSDGETETSFVR